MAEPKKEISEIKINTSTPEPETKIITYTNFKVISTEKKDRVTTALTVKLSAVSPSKTDSVEKSNQDQTKDDGDDVNHIVRKVIKLDLTSKRHPKYIPTSNGRVSPGLLADPGEELLIQKIIQNHKKYSRDYLMGLRESKRALQLPVGLPNIPDLLPTSKQVIIVQTNSNAGPHKSNHHKQGHHHNNYHHHQNNNNQVPGSVSGHHHHNNSNNNNNQHSGHQNQHHNTGYNPNHNANNQGGYHNNRRNTVGAIHNNNNHHGQGGNNYQNNNYNKYYNNQHHNNHFNQNYNKKHANNNNNTNANNNTNQG